jgi:FkbM family methyltransferase
MRKVLEIRNIFKEMIKGTSIEPFARSIVDFVNPPGPSFITNKHNNACTNKIMERVLTKQSNCIDIGCNTGEFLNQILQLAPLGYHYAFEPIPRLASRLRKRFPNTDVRQIALSDLEGETTFWYVVSSPALSSLKQPSNSSDTSAPTETITVKTERLDDILAPEFKIDFIKVDVEGVELQVFQGGIRTLKTHKPYIVFEHGGTDSKEWHDGRWHDERIYDLLVNECSLKIFELGSWLEGLAPLSRDEFTKSSAWNFLATP